MTIIQDYLSYRFGSASGLSSEQMEALVGQFARGPQKASDVLGGRNQPHFADIKGLGPVVIKHYFRGGLIRHVNRRTYLRWTKTRSEAEFDLLGRIRKLGINAPEPVAFGFKGRFFYQAWLVMKKIPASVSLAELSLSAPEHAEAVMPSVLEQISRLIENGILHVDLHPGNVLIAPDRQVFIIDLDKAKPGRKNRSRLLQRYLRRWDRAIVKYNLPAFLRNRMAAGLMEDIGI